MYKIGLLLVLILGAFFAIFNNGGKEYTSTNVVPEYRIPHIIDDSEQKLSTVEIIGLYFVPADRTHRIYESWHEKFENALNQLALFHESQFHGLSKIRYVIVPDIVIGEKTGANYDVAAVQHGNARALYAIGGEVKRRLQQSGGDLYDETYTKEEDGLYRVFVILFEGEGASGADTIALVPRSVLTNEVYDSIGPTVVAHEFYHTLGLQDAYDVTNIVYAEDAIVSRSAPYQNDIMGLGVTRPLSATYIESATLKTLGL